MAIVATIRHRAAISGYVSDAVSGAGIAGAVVTLEGQDQQTRTHADGFYYFLDLANGAYTLHAEAPALGSRYGSVTATGVSVASDSVGRPLFDPKGNLALPPTRLTGLVRRSDNLAPIAYADVQLRASRVTSKSNKLGQYVLSAVEAGTQTMQVTALGFTTISQPVSLIAGQSIVVDFNLTPS
jgi:hypothetical protein